MSITVLDLDGGLIVSIVAVYHQDARQFLLPEDTPGHRGGSGVLEGEHTGLGGTK
jgi:hypothetical protein